MSFCYQIFPLFWKNIFLPSLNTISYSLFGQARIKIFNFTNISKIFANVRVIYSDIKSETITVSTTLCKLSINIAQA